MLAEETASVTISDLVLRKSISERVKSVKTQSRALEDQNFTQVFTKINFDAKNQRLPNVFDSSW